MLGDKEKKLSDKKDFWIEFFTGRRDGGHRSSSEEFISMWGSSLSGGK